MASHSRHSRTVLSLLALLGSTPGALSQTPAAFPAIPAAPPPPPAAVTAPKPIDSAFGAMQVVDLLNSLAHYDQDGRQAAQKIGFEVPERAVNDYLVYSLHNRPRPAISSATVALTPGNNVTVTVELDFDAIQQWVPELLPEALRPMFTGKRLVKVNAHFESSNGNVSFALKDVTGPNGKPFDAKLMNALMQSLGAKQPEAYDTSKPLPLPFGLKRIWTDKQSILGET